MILKISEIKTATPNDKEHVSFEVVQEGSLMEFAIVANSAPDQSHFFKFPDYNVSAADIIKVYTGCGESKLTSNGSGSKTLHFYWGLDQILWQNKGAEVELIKLIKHQLEMA